MMPCRAPKCRGNDPCSKCAVQICAGLLNAIREAGVTRRQAGVILALFAKVFEREPEHPLKPVVDKNP